MEQTLYSITARLLSLWLPFTLCAALCSCFTQQTAPSNALETGSVCSLLTIVQLNVQIWKLRSGVGTVCSATPRFTQCAFHTDLWLENRLNVRRAAAQPSVYHTHTHTLYFSVWSHKSRHSLMCSVTTQADTRPVSPWCMCVCVCDQTQTLKEVVTLLQGLTDNLVWWTDRRTDRQVTSDNMSDWCHGDRTIAVLCVTF